MIRFLLLLAITLSMKSDKFQEEGNTLFYIGDPMCSWCYGFGPEITQIKKQLPKGVQFEIIMGGLRPYGTQTMKELQDFLKGHWVEIHERTGQDFSYDILQQADFIYDTEPACRAVVTAREMAANKALPFFKAVQKAFYAENKNTAKLETYLAIAKNLELDVLEFEKRFLSDEMKAATKLDFQIAGQMGINSFPSLVLKKGEEYFLVGRGYAEAEGILEGIGKVLE